LDRLEEEVQGISVNANKLLADVNTLVTEALPSGKPNLKQIGEHLGMSNRTLKRRLADHGIAFRDLVQGIQRELSIQLLRTTEQSIGEIAFQTGFSEQSAFNRAFKRWTGTSPTEYRKSD
jgi:AraC-like DNA-binding protein